MRVILGLLLIVVSFAACSSSDQPTKTERNTDGWKDTTVLKELVRYNMSQAPFMRSLYKYNKEGQLIKEVMWDSSGLGVRIQNRFITYENDKPITVRLKDPQGKQIYQIDYTYNEDGNMIEEVYTDDAGTSRKIQRYDERGNPIEVISIDQTGAERRQVFTYNAANEVDTAISYLPDGTRQQMNIYQYKNDTLMTDCLFIDENDSVYLHWTYSYNDQGKLESEYEKAANGTQFVIKRYFFNDKGQKIREEGYKGRMYTTHYMYDAAGNLAEQRTVDNSGIIRSRRFYGPPNDQRN